MRPRPSHDPDLLPAPPVSDDLTDYDYRLLIVYLRLLDAEADGADWAQVAQIVLRLDPAQDPDGARVIHAAHLARAHWMRDHGHYKLLTDTMEMMLPGEQLHRIGHARPIMPPVASHIHPGGFPPGEPGNCCPAPHTKFYRTTRRPTNYSFMNNHCIFSCLRECHRGLDGHQTFSEDKILNLLC